MKEDQKYTTVHYQNYLALDKILGAQNLRSEKLDERPAHEEMLFIIVHQSYELWFKQIIHELQSVLNLFATDQVDERNIGISIARLERVIEIQKLLIEQIRIMETMTPLDFLDFRNHLFPASGFQSFQFRMIENLLGLVNKQRMTYNGCPYSSVFDDDKKGQLDSTERGKSLFLAVEDWLERTPFLHLGSFEFLKEYRSALERMLDKEKAAIKSSDFLSATEKEGRLKMLGDTDSYFETVLNEDKYNEKVRNGEVRLSYKATIAALLINLYRDEPILHLPFRLLTTLIEIDDTLTTWRYRHAQMVLRMLGNKIGTGGSSGHEYLIQTASKHQIFKDLHNISTLLIPRSEIPKLPSEVQQILGFYYSEK